MLLSAAIIAGLLLSLALAGEFRGLSAGSDRRFWKTMHDTRKDDQVYVMGKVLSGGYGNRISSLNLIAAESSEPTL